ncbi:peroxidase 29-like [Cornus florida]|uniref:peroxidase 29-like n=1 Tax=Cornus florida TaxID=4283 RepID=UPI00289E859F|nr:peroxidase 29-like [Cornus florida]
MDKELEESSTVLLAMGIEVAKTEILENKQRADMALSETQKMAFATQRWEPVKRQGKLPMQHENAVGRTDRTQFSLVMGVFIGLNEARLSFHYYETTCPDVENIVRQELTSIFMNDATAPASFLRLLFHDCQVQGCDASILLDFDEIGKTSEAISSKNFGINKREMIDRIKSVVEMVCPGQVSCADIIALAAKESVSFSGGPRIHIPFGRKDSTTCSHRQADIRLPTPGISIDDFFNIFTTKGMNLEESVSMLGAHTLGVGHCLNIVERLYDPKPDDWMDFRFGAQLRFNCPNPFPLTNLALVPNDITPFTFDNQYYTDVLMGRGLFVIDSNISRDPRTAPIVGKFAADQNYFFQVFSSAFIKLSVTNVLTGKNGEVRRQCNRVNSDL